jgi:hypothetical protein
MSYNESLNPNSNYPPMSQSEWDSAPWNQVDVPEKEFEVTCSQTLSKTTSIWTNDYIPGASGVDYEPDDEGGYCAIGWQDPDDTSETDWRQAYNDVAMTPLDIINACETLAKHLLEQGTTSIGHLRMKELIKECEGWNDDDYEVVEG